MRLAKAHRTIGPRIRISRPDGGSARCNASRARAQPRSSSQPTPPSTHFQRPTPFDVPPHARRRPRRSVPDVASRQRGLSPNWDFQNCAQPNSVPATRPAEASARTIACRPQATCPASPDTRVRLFLFDLRRRRAASLGHKFHPPNQLFQSSVSMANTRA
jgi:hypothetical protein